MPKSKSAKQRQRNNDQEKQSTFVAEQLKKHLFSGEPEDEGSSDENSGDEAAYYENNNNETTYGRDYRPAATKTKTQAAESKTTHQKVVEDSYVPTTATSSTTSGGKKTHQQQDYHDDDDDDDDHDIKNHQNNRHTELGVGGGAGGGGGKSGKNALVGASTSDAASGAGGTVAANQSREKDRSERATVETVMDPRTRLILHKMVNSGLLDRVHGCVSTGKEANVYLGILGEAGPGIWENQQQQMEAAAASSSTTKDNNNAKSSTSNGKETSSSVHFHPQQYTANKKKMQQQQNASKKSSASTQKEVEGESAVGAPALIPNEDTTTTKSATDHPFQPQAFIALKIYKTSILVFKDREKYVAGEYRFQRYCKSNPRKMVRTWAEKESRNLNRLYNGGVPCPRVFLLRQHILAMEFVGTEGWPAPRLKDVRLSPSAFEKCYFQVVVGMRKMFLDCRLVHGDLSEFNLLVYNGKVIFIDVSQSVEHDHPLSMDFLRRDIVNVHTFFKSRGVGCCMSHRELFEFITSPLETAAWFKDPEGWLQEQKESWRNRNEGTTANENDENGEGAGGGDEQDAAAAAAALRARKEDEVFLQVPVPRDLRGDTVQKSLANPDVAPLMRAMLGIQGFDNYDKNAGKNADDDDASSDDDDEEEEEEESDDDHVDGKQEISLKIKTVKLVHNSDDEDEDQDEESDDDDDNNNNNATEDNYLTRYDSWCQSDETLKAATPEILAKVRNHLLEHSKGLAKLALMSKDEKRLFQHAIKLEQRKKRTEKVPKHVKRRATKKHMKK